MPAVLVQEAVTRQVIGAFYDVFNRLGYGFLEAVYANALEIELRERRQRVEREVPVQVNYRGRSIGEYRADLIVGGTVLVEIKATKTLEAHARQQLLNYIRGTDLEVGILLHFGPKPRFERIISSVTDPRRSAGPPAAAGGIRGNPRPSGPGAP